MEPPASTTRGYRWSAVALAGAAFAFALSSSRTQEPTLLYTHSTIAAASLIDVPEPEAIDLSPSPVDDDVLPERPFMRPAPERVVVAATPSPAAPSIVPLSTPPAVQTVPITAVVTTPPPAFVPRVADDKSLVEETLGRYRRAYNRLDARSAQAVYPNLNAPALARAFDGLQSQWLQFDECDIDVRGVSAAVTCRGSSRYVPKIGNRDTHVEPRVWDFTLRKDEGDWKIQNARATR